MRDDSGFAWFVGRCCDGVSIGWEGEVALGVLRLVVGTGSRTARLCGGSYAAYLW